MPALKPEICRDVISERRIYLSREENNTFCVVTFVSRSHPQKLSNC